MHSILAISQHVNGILEGDQSIQIHRINNIADAENGDISFIVQAKYAKFLPLTAASAVLVSRDFEVKGKKVPTLIRVENVQKSLNTLLELFAPNDIFEQGREELMHISPESRIHPSVQIGNFSHISAGVEIGEGSQIGSQVFLGKNVKIGNNVLIYPGVKMYRNCQVNDHCIIHSNVVIGSDGFGYMKNGEAYDKIPQIGNVIIEEGVEIGANTVIDRSTFSSTLIRKGVKLDNLIQVAHNVELGENTIVAAQTGIAGSVKLGKNCVVGGQSAFVPHIEIAEGNMFQGKSGVSRSIREAGGKHFGIPAIPFNDFIRSYAVFKILPELEAKIKRLENDLNQLKKG